MRCPPRVPSVVMDAMFVVPVVPCHATGACLAEKSPLTNRIRRQFARIKAARTDRTRSWLPRQMATVRGHVEGDGPGTPELKSGNVRAVCWGDHAARHSTANFGVSARATGGFCLDHPPGAEIRHQSSVHRGAELV